MTVFEMAQKYYPRLWDDNRINALVEAGRLTDEDRERLREGAEWLTKNVS